MSKSLSMRMPSTHFRAIRFALSTILIIVSLGFAGCTSSIEKTSPMLPTTFEVPIKVLYPDALAELRIISDLPGMIRLIGYSGSDFVLGSVEVSNSEWAPKIENSIGKVSLIQTASKHITHIQDSTNLWKMRVSDSKPFRLQIQNSQAEGHWNFSGLPITDLYAELGAAKNAFTCDETNPIDMQKCELHCGTGDVVIEGILNTLCQNMIIQAGTGNLTLRFGGKEIFQSLKASIHATTGVINITLSSEIPARIIISSEGKVMWGEGIIKSDESRNDNFETTSYHSVAGNKIEISISGGSGLIYLNSPPS